MKSIPVLVAAVGRHLPLRYLASLLLIPICMVVYYYLPRVLHPVHYRYLGPLYVLSIAPIEKSIFFTGYERERDEETRLECVYELSAQEPRELLCGGLSTPTIPQELSVDGDLVVFSGINNLAFREKGNDLFRLSIRGGQVGVLLSEPGDERHPDIANGTIAFERDGMVRYARMDDSAIQARLEDIAPGTTPSVSPDGTEICFTRVVREHGEEREDIYVYSTGTGALRRVTRGGRHNRSPDWSPNGRFITFVSDRHMVKGGGIWVVSADGSRYFSITRTATEDHAGPRWADGGRQIVFMCTDTPDSVEGYRICEVELGAKFLTVD